ncbi:MAG TPA: sialidase family protein [Tepidisphaeraceae bacterium]|nr:sialidase family protein [Tepidisphaeraceae bacterium]
MRIPVGILLCICLMCGVGQSFSAPSTRPVTGCNIAGAEHGIVYEKEGVYACFPTLTKLADGRLVTTFATRTHASHVDDAGGKQTMISADGRSTWQPFDEPVIKPHWTCADGRLVNVDADGWIRVPESARARLTAEKRTIANVRPGTIAYLGGAHYRVSTDGAKTWQTHAIDVPHDIAGLMCHLDDASFVKTTGGVRLKIIYGTLKGKSGHRVFTVRSEDDGKSWVLRAMLADPPPDGLQGFNETAVIELSDRSLLAMMRSQPEGFLYRSMSSDQGRSWTPAQKTEIWGFPADLLLLPDHRVLCVYGYRREPMGVRASISADNGKTWNLSQEMILRADHRGKGMDLGYPLVEPLPDGRLLALYYIDTDGSRTRVHIAWTR